jgi:hypothetical protein
VSPKGNAFISFGVNHYHADWWAQEHNRDYWIERFKAKKPYDDMENCVREIASNLYNFTSSS